MRYTEQDQSQIGRLISDEFLNGLMDLLGREKVFLLRKQALEHLCQTEMEVTGKILGGAFTIRLEFDGEQL